MLMFLNPNLSNRQAVAMKSSLSFFMVALMAIMISILSCKKGEWGDLEYSDVSATNWLQANVKKKSGEGVLWFQVFDQVEDELTIDGYRNSSERINAYPAKIYENKWVWLMVNNRIEIRVIADSKSNEFQNTDKLKKFILSFDLAGMKQVRGPKLKGKDLEKFIPRLGDKR
jgi:hypothetical protein